MKLGRKKLRVLGMLLILGIFIMPLMVTPAQAVSSYVEDYRFSEGGMINVTVHNPSSKTEDVCIECKIREYCLWCRSYEECEWIAGNARREKSTCQQIGPGEHITVRYSAGALIPHTIPDSVYYDELEECRLTRCPACFIATAAYGTSTAEEIDILRDFRDDVLIQNDLGKELVESYYTVSPPLANIISEHDICRTFVRETIIDPIVWVISKTEDYWRG